MGELGETPFEPFKEEQEEGMTIDISLDKQITTINESFIKFFKGTSSKVGIFFLGANSSSVCPMCKSSDHIDKCCLPHKTENCSVKCGHCFSMDI